MDSRRCQSTTVAGKPCSARPVPGSTFCPWHAPDYAQRRQEWSRKGGEHKSNQARARKALPTGLLTASELQGLLGLVLKGTMAGTTSPPIGMACAALARAIIAVAGVAEFETRLAELERRA